ncbi:DUF1513 domain-containing protein [Marinobacterium arenosum]|uniref:DUF1513 domain-containing protein n=1 Tax=Marinobacterium arenosum TaxID=2862496 RepID=UPI001C97F7D2|nr:DUF1513 domain-containing protein [Marinobacterium arenosum]MBY4676515.1 DUF1513 domain-containing protein [Marinobacterium arenosum]
MTGINRRQFLTALGAGLLLPAVPSLAAAPALRFASAGQDGDNNHWLTLFDDQGQLLLKHQLPGRAHHVAAHPTEPWLMAVARRPDRFIELVDYQSGELIQRIEAGPQRHFYGHGIFSADGRWLAATENHLPSGEGRLVIRDCRDNFRTVADHPSYGIGPHELAYLPDQRTLVVANGGILTHPEQGRKKLNLDSMQPTLAYIDSASGRLLEQVSMPAELHQLSIRHLDINRHGEVAIALQYQGGKQDRVPLVALHRQGQPLQLLEAPEPVRLAMRQYCGSARFDRSGELFAISSPRGDLVTLWQRDGRFIDSFRVRDGCGLAATDRDGEFVISSGNGRCYRYDLDSGRKQKLPTLMSSSLAWDNHMVHL